MKKKAAEGFQTDSNSNSDSGVISTISIFLSLAIGIYAIYLSWSCNSAKGIGTGLKILYAFFAWVFGIFYLIFYLIVNAGRCYPLPTPAAK